MPSSAGSLLFIAPVRWMSGFSDWRTAGLLKPSVARLDRLVTAELSLAVGYDPASGQHALKLHLLHRVADAEPKFTRVPADKVKGNTIGPFEEGQVIELQTDMGNSRDISKLSDPQTKTIAPAV